MNIYLVERGSFSKPNSYDSVVVVAHSVNSARRIHPSKIVTHIKDGKWMCTNFMGKEYEYKFDSWVPFSNIDLLKVKKIGVADKNVKPGVVNASYYKL